MKKFLVLNNETLETSICYMKNMAKKKEPFDVIIKSYYDKRSSNQLRYYWVLMSVITDALGREGNNMTKEETSDLMKSMFFYKSVTLPNNMVRKGLKSIADKSDTDKQEMANFITQIIAWCCCEMNIGVPECDSEYNIVYMKFMQNIIKALAIENIVLNKLTIFHYQIKQNGLLTVNIFRNSKNNDLKIFVQNTTKSIIININDKSLIKKIISLAYAETDILCPEEDIAIRIRSYAKPKKDY